MKTGARQPINEGNPQVISSISLSGVPPYVADADQLKDLNKVNVIYGQNGTGKTQLSRILRNVELDPKTPDSERLSWERSVHERLLVYNYEYVDKCVTPDTIPGVFTLGEEAAETKAQIEELNKNLEGSRGLVTRYEFMLNGDADRPGGRYQALEDCKRQFEDACWKYRNQSKEVNRAFEGHRNSRRAFADFVDSIEATEQVTESLDELSARSSKAYSSDVKPCDPLELPDLDVLTRVESSELFARKIVGSSNLNISGLIARLNNGGWVSKGLTYLGQSKGVCPFCQQPVSDELKSEIESYFDEGYLAAKGVLEEFGAKLALLLKEASSLSEKLKGYAEVADTSALSQSLKSLQLITQEYQRVVATKLDNLANPITVKPLGSVADEMQRDLEVFNVLIAEHNRIVGDRAAEQKRVNEEIRRKVAQELDGEINAYRKQAVPLVKAIESVSKKLSEAQEVVSETEGKIRRLEESISGIQAVADGINQYLSDMGFLNFSIALSDDGKGYKLVRQNGASAAETLSEGERTFIAFLYFYSMNEGSTRGAGQSADRIMVFDDPISSLDSSVLFAVSAMLRSLANRVRNGEGNVKQLIVLTHNISFYYQFTYVSAGNPNDSTSHYLIRKIDSGSAIEYRGHQRPINSSYEELWLLLKSKDNDLFVGNAARRIAETFFKFVGGMNIDATIKQLPSAQKAMGSWLLDWSHASSHILMDGVDFDYRAVPRESVLQALRAIFEANGQLDHFKMMMDKTGA